MQAEISIHLRGGDKQPAVVRDSAGTTNWIGIVATEGASESTLTIFGTPEQLDAFIDQIAALRTSEQKATA